jgi:hypothetical protein
MSTAVEIALWLSPLLCAAGFVFLAFAAGGGLAARLADRELATTSWLALALPLGLGLLGQALFAWGVVGRFGLPAVALVAAIALRFGWRELAVASRELEAFLALSNPRRRALVAFMAVAFAAPALLALYPPVAWDDTIYHLPLARSLAEHGRYLFVDNLRAPVFPLLAETLYAPALLLGRASTAHGLALAATFGTALLLLAWGRDLEGAPEGKAPTSPASRWAWELAPAAIWVGQPIVVYYAGTSYVEPLLTLFTTASALAFERWRRDREPAWLLAAGAFAGWGAATKYHGLYLVAALALAAAWQAGRGRRTAALARFASSAALAAGPWFALVWYLSGNPLFPFFSGIFGTTAWTGTGSLNANSLDSGPWQAAVDLFRLGWDLVGDRARLNSQPFASPLVVCALPLLAYAAWRRRDRRFWIAILGGYVLALVALPRDSRYLMCFSPLLSILMVVALRELASLARATALRRPGAVAALVVLALAGGPAYGVWRLWRIGPPPVSPAAIDDFLARRVPLYRALLFRRAHGLEGVPLYALHGERLHDFGGAALLGDWTGTYRYALVLPLLGRPEELARRLQDLGAGQLLLPRALIDPALVEGISASPRFRVLYRDGEAVLLALRPAD